MARSTSSKFASPTRTSRRCSSNRQQPVASSVPPSTRSVSPKLGRWVHLTVTTTSRLCRTALGASSRCSCSEVLTVNHGRRLFLPRWAPLGQLYTSRLSPVLSRVTMVSLSTVLMSTPTLPRLSRRMARLNRQLVETSERRESRNPALTCRHSTFVYATILHDRSSSIQQPHHSWSTLLIISNATARRLG